MDSAPDIATSWALVPRPEDRSRHWPSASVWRPDRDAALVGTVGGPRLPAGTDIMGVGSVNGKRAIHRPLVGQRPLHDRLEVSGELPDLGESGRIDAVARLDVVEQREQGRPLEDARRNGSPEPRQGAVRERGVGP